MMNDKMAAGLRAKSVFSIGRCISRQEGSRQGNKNPGLPQSRTNAHTKESFPYNK
jgi:hypothetical protein